VVLWFSAWLQDHAITLGAVNDELLDQFVAGFVPGTPGRAMTMCRLPVIRRYLFDPHSRSPRAKEPELVGLAGRELDTWGAWQREQGGISERVVLNRRRWVGAFVTGLTEGDTLGWDRVDVAMINVFITKRGTGYAPASCSLLVSAMRCLLRWALVTGRVERDLNRGILRSRATRVTLPRGLSRQQLDALLATTNCESVVGVRDRAVLIVLSRLGIRAGEAAGLTLEDINWAAGRLSVVGKGQRRLTVPLPADVGRALVAWLKVRPWQTQDRAVFVRVRAPIGKLTSAGISDIVVHSAQRAGLGVIHAHRLRHTAAMNVIAAGGTLLEAQELLGHSRADSTHIYARTDLVSLRALAVPFGQVPS
jgi:site-specific recombinase XerC